MKRGFTLIEVVVAIGIFAVLMVGTSLLLVSTLRGAKKAAAQIAVRSEGAWAMDLMSSTLRFSQRVTSCTTGTGISVQLGDGSNVTFACQGSSPDYYLASGSGRLTSTNVALVSCANVFVCPDTKTIKIQFGLLKAGTNLQIENTSQINFDSEIRLRN